MYSQVYFHAVRRIYDIHLMDFLQETLEDGVFSTDLDKHLRTTDNDVMTRLWDAANSPSQPGHVHADRIVGRKHFRVVYARNPSDVAINPEAGAAVYEALCNRFETEDVRRDRSQPRSVPQDFPVKLGDEVVSSLAVSDVLEQVPVWSVDNVFVDASRAEEAKSWVQDNRADIIRPPEEVDGG